MTTISRALAAAALLSMAVEVNNGQRDFHMLHARKWYDSQPALLR